MAYAHVLSGQVTETRLPRSGVLSDGRPVSGYHLLPPSVLHAEGWREIVDSGPPSHNPSTHLAAVTGHEYDTGEDVVRVVYTLYEVGEEGTVSPVPSPDGHHDPVIGAPDG